LPQRAFTYEEGSRGDLAKASREGLRPRPVEDPSLVVAAPAQSLEKKPPGDVAGNAIWKTLRSFLGMPEASTVQAEADRLSGKSNTP